MRKLAIASLIPAGALVLGLLGAGPTPDGRKARAYELYAQKDFTNSIADFRAYLQQRPDDVQAAVDLAGVLSDTRQHAEAAKVLEGIHQRHPANESAYFKLAVELVYQGRSEEAAKIFNELQQSSNRALAEAAADALRTLSKTIAHEQRLRAEQQVFALAEKSEHEKVIQAVNELERTGPLTFALSMQRLYAMHSLRQYAPALERANTLARVYPSAPELTLMRAELLAQLGQRAEAIALWKQLEQENAGTPSAAEAAKRRQASEKWLDEDRVYELARQQKDREVLVAIDEIERHRELSFPMRMQRLYALAAVGQTRRALQEANELAKTEKEPAELALIRADLYARSDNKAEAEKIWKTIATDFAQTPASFEAERRVRELQAGREGNRQEERIFSLARQNEHREVVAAIDELEKKRGELPWLLEMQRLYALQGAGEISRALDKANDLAQKRPDALDLRLLRGYLLAGAGQQEQSKELFADVEKENPGSAAAESARKQLEAFAAAEKQPPGPEAGIYALAAQQRYRETVEAIDGLERKGPLSFAMRMQRLYALQAMGNYGRAEIEARNVGAAYPHTPELALIRADLLIQNKQWEDASLVLKQIRYEQPDSPSAVEAERRLDALPPIANLEKWYWGEAYNSGDYMGRFGTVVGSGFLRHGYFIPFARWLQPYAEFRYTADTRSGRDQRTTVADNFVGGYAGARVQPFAGEYLFAYLQAGVNKDLLDRRHGGDPAFDYQGGLYGFKSWGPGTVLLSLAPGEAIKTSGSSFNPAREIAADTKKSPDQVLLFRGGWFSDAAADFSYYHRHSSWIGYGQAHEGFRLFQLGPHAGIDAYAVENLSWDIRGNYFDNLGEVGPGARLLWVPKRKWEVIFRAEWLNGFYFGRDELNNRGGAASHYDDFRVGLSVGTRW